MFEFDDETNHFLVIRANVSRKQESSRENDEIYLELAVTIFFRDVNRIAWVSGCSYSRGRRRKHPVIPPYPNLLLRNTGCSSCCRRIVLLSPLESSSLSTMKTLQNTYIAFGFLPSHPAVIWALRHVRLFDTNAKGRTGDWRDILVTIEHERSDRDTRLDYRDLPVLQNYLRYLPSCFYPRIHLQHLWHRF